jgi:hypothetical protein
MSAFPAINKPSPTYRPDSSSIKRGHVSAINLRGLVGSCFVGPVQKPGKLMQDGRGCHGKSHLSRGVNISANLTISDFIQALELRSAVHDIVSDKEKRIEYVHIL